jgi:hypothetical protein
MAGQAPIGVLQPVADERWTHTCLSVQACPNGAVQPRDDVGGDRCPTQWGGFQKGGHWRLLLLKRLPEPGRLGRCGSALQRGSLNGRMPTRATIHPNGTAAGSKRLLSLSVGWLLDRGFM